MKGWQTLIIVIACLVAAWIILGIEPPPAEPKADYWQVQTLHKSCPGCCWERAWCEWEPYTDKCRAEEAAQVGRERWSRYKWRVVPVTKGRDSFERVK